MNSSEAERQINQMIEFIKQEATERADEINVTTQKECNAKKLNKIAQARRELRDEFEAKRKESGTQKRIAQSKIVNNARFHVMRVRDKLMKQVQQETHARLADVPKNPKYPQLIEQLLVQGFLTNLENKLEVTCRKEDVAVVQAALPKARAAFIKLVQEVCGVTPECNVTLNTAFHLPPAPRPGFEGKTCAGGVVVSSLHGKIKVDNTLDGRFEQVFYKMKPVTKDMLFAGIKVGLAGHT